MYIFNREVFQNLRRYEPFKWKMQIIHWTYFFLIMVKIQTHFKILTFSTDPLLFSLCGNSTCKYVKNQKINFSSLSLFKIIKNSTFVLNHTNAGEIILKQVYSNWSLAKVNQRKWFKLTPKFILLVIRACSLLCSIRVYISLHFQYSFGKLVLCLSVSALFWVICHLQRFQ